MGLAAPRKRTKISHDPNNNTWSNSTTRFGEKVLQDQGWKPGSYLGALNAPHAALHTEANASHIRVIAKDDNLGLGAKAGSKSTDRPPTGLDSYQNLLGRLNGKTEAKLTVEQQSRDGVRRREYVNQRWGSSRFVSAGFLVRKDPTASELSVIKNQVIETGVTVEADEEVQAVSTIETMSVGPDNAVLKEEEEKRQAKRLRKAEKAQRKLQKERRRETKRVRKEERRQQRALLVSKSPVVASDTMTTILSPCPPDQQKQECLSGRHTAVRSRSIRQKKLAVMDSKALNEILMLRV